MAKVAGTGDNPWAVSGLLGTGRVQGYRWASAPVTMNHHLLATAWSSAELSSLPLTFPLLTQCESLQTIVKYLSNSLQNLY
jgi:hypothetical protein